MLRNCPIKLLTNPFSNKKIIAECGVYLESFLNLGQDLLVKFSCFMRKLKIKAPDSARWSPG